MGEQNTMDEKGFEAMLVFMTVFYFILMIPTIVGFFFEDKPLKERVVLLEARMCDLERKCIKL